MSPSVNQSRNARHLSPLISYQWFKYCRMVVFEWALPTLTLEVALEKEWIVLLRNAELPAKH